MNGISFDGSVNLGQVVEALIFLIGGGIAYGSATKQLEDVQSKVTTLQDELGKITAIMIQNAARDEREKAMAIRLEKLENIVEVMRKLP
jgi:hypothetical protein